MSVSIRFILLVCAAIFSLNVYLYLQESASKTVSEQSAIQNTLIGDHNAGSGQTKDVYNSVD